MKNEENSADGGVMYYGKIISIPGDEGFAFIGIQTVTDEDGGKPEDFPTKEDIFLHQDECASSLRVGMTVGFYVGEDRRRGEGYCRAFGAIELVTAELLPSNAPPVPGFYAMTRVEDNALVPLSPRSSYHLAAKEVPSETVEKVILNEPMPEIPRGCNDFSEDEKIRLLAEMLQLFFPAMAHFSADFDVLNMSSEELDQAVRDSEADLEALGMTQQIEEIRKEVERFKGMKNTLRLIFDDGLVRPDTIIPIKYLPDLFVAAPVWYFWLKPEKIGQTEEAWANEDPVPQEEIRYFCGLFPNRNWSDTYQMFNRRMRSLKMYSGDKVPPFVSRRLRKAVEAFDYVVIVTPYHQEAGKDWQDIKWLQLIDPYVLGFKKGIPYFFILARFSDSGTFPLYHEMVADTVEFLRANKAKLEGFNKVSAPFWFDGERQETTSLHSLGTTLMAHTDRLIEAFEQGDLFDWLRNGSDYKAK